MRNLFIVTTKGFVILYNLLSSIKTQKRSCKKRPDAMWGK